MASLIRRFALAASALSFLLLVMSAVASAAITVTNTNDTGPGSLRAAITLANGSPTVATTINFTVSGTITLETSLPAIANISPNGSFDDRWKRSSDHCRCSILESNFQREFRRYPQPAEPDHN
jgi:hypothetical protein